MELHTHPFRPQPRTLALHRRLYHIAEPCQRSFFLKKGLCTNRCLEEENTQRRRTFHSNVVAGFNFIFGVG